MKTIHFTNYFHESSGGIGVFYRQLLAGANRHGRFLRLVAPAAEDGVEEVGEFGRIYRLQATRSPAFDSRYRLILPHRYLLPGDTKIKRILREEDADLVEVCDKYSLIYLASALRKGWIPGVRRVPIVGHSAERMDHNVSVFLSGAKAAGWFARWYIKWVYLPMCDFHTACSVYTAQELADASAVHTTHRRRVYALPMGVDAQRFRPSRRDASLRADLLARCGLDGNGRLLLYAGRLSPEKNLDLLADTMTRLGAAPGAPYALAVAGDGPSRADFFSKLETAAPGRFVPLGHVADPEHLANLYASADAFVHPNPYEPYGIAPLEAMASGSALVAPNSGGVLSYANAGNAWLGAPEAAVFAELAQAASGDDPNREAKLHAARAAAERQDWPLVIDRCFSLYDELIAGFPAWLARTPEERLEEPVLQVWDGEPRAAEVAAIPRHR